MDFSDAITIGGYIAAVVAAVMVGRARATKETIDNQGKALEAAKDRIAILEADVADAKQKAVDTDRECDKKIEHLRGRIDTLENLQTDALAEGISERLAPKVIPAIRSGLAQDIIEWNTRNE